MTARRTSAVALLAALIAGCAVAPPPAPSASMTSTPNPGTATTQPHSAPPPLTGGPERIDSRPMARPAQPLLVARFEASLVDDPCIDRDIAAPPASDVLLTVLDRTYALPASYVPDDLVPAAEAGLTGTSGTKLVRSVLLNDLAAMHQAWEAAGLTVVIDSAYRSYAAQAATFDSWVNLIGLEEALARTARPGHSEHQLGTALDVSSPGWSGRFGDWAAESAEGAWMSEHAWEYGFVMSYPAGGQDATCFGYEPWHYRWIGREAAAEHRNAGVVLREFLERYVRG